MAPLLAAALYLDFLTLASVAQIATWLVAGPELPLAALLAICLVVSLLAQKFQLSPGRWLVTPMAARRAAGQWTTRSWITLVAGIVAILEGSKHFVRWTNIDQPLPLFGWVPANDEIIILGLALGVAFLGIGMLVLRMHAIGKILGIAISGMLIGSTLVSWDVLPEAIEKQAMARRAAQGLPPSPAHTEAMKNWLPTVMIGFEVVMICLFIGAENERRPRPRRHVAPTRN